MLYPKSNKYRDVYNLNGLWNFKTTDENYCGAQEDGWQLMPVPASYNEIVTDKAIRDHVGKVVYEREFSVPIRKGLRYRLRIGATSHKCEIYLNGEKIGVGINGFYPIDLPLENLKDTNRLSVVIDNRLTFQTLPVGKIVNGKQVINHDFYNFTGIHRDVLVYTLPEKHIDDIQIKTVVENDYERVRVELETNCERAHFTVFDKDKKVVVESDCPDFCVPAPHLWCTENPYLYTLRVETETDLYEERFGIRKISWNENSLFLNDKPVYLKGFGMHEDFFVSGKGNNSPLNVRNFELLKWCNANSIRTSHYPYSEEIMSLADEYGIMVIDEVPAVGMNWWEKNFSPETINEKTCELHKELIKQLIERDKNHPSVILLSVANEAGTHELEAREYFKEITAFARSVTDLPLTIVEFSTADDSKIGDLIDIVAINRYYGWYYDHGDISVIKDCMKTELTKWHEKYNKPVMVAEFGADTIEGLHAFPSESFSEEFQREYLEENCKAFDECEFFIGEHVWNFADFKTKQGLTRIRGNRKGIFTKDRQPKLAAHYMRERWSKK